jgi:prepilin-type N-terminal cleavage/methylation domain-containing protein
MMNREMMRQTSFILVATRGGRRSSVVPRYGQRAFSLLELLLSIAIIAVLIGLLLPLLVYARSAARTTICAGNLRQMSTAWSLYLTEYGSFPQYTKQPDWKYGGARFNAVTGDPHLADDRPINAYMADNGVESAGNVSLLFRCPADKGVAKGALADGELFQQGAPAMTSCFEQFGTSYRANPYLMDSTRAGLDDLHRPLAMHEIEHVPTSRLLLVGDAEWYFATSSADKLESTYEAAWHDRPDSGNMLAVDGSVRFTQFQLGEGPDYLIYPRP